VENDLKVTVLPQKCNLPYRVFDIDKSVNEGNVDWLTCPNSS